MLGAHSSTGADAKAQRRKRVPCGCSGGEVAFGGPEGYREPDPCLN